MILSRKPVLGERARKAVTSILPQAHNFQRLLFFISSRKKHMTVISSLVLKLKEKCSTSKDICNRMDQNRSL